MEQNNIHMPLSLCPTHSFVGKLDYGEEYVIYADTYTAVSANHLYICLSVTDSLRRWRCPPHLAQEKGKELGNDRGTRLRRYAANKRHRHSDDNRSWKRERRAKFRVGTSSSDDEYDENGHKSSPSIPFRALFRPTHARSSQDIEVCVGVSQYPQKRCRSGGGKKTKRR